MIETDKLIIYDFDTRTATLESKHNSYGKVHDDLKTFGYILIKCTNNTLKI